MDGTGCPSRGTGLSDLKQEVRRFYDAIGWRHIGEGLYQNARYEDLRDVSRDYVQRCHRRVRRFLPKNGKYLLDAGSGPIQYPEYLEYSEDFSFRVCLDISKVALDEARIRIAEHGLFVIADIARLPFRDDIFKGIVSLHTIHHLPGDEHQLAFKELLRTLAHQGCAVIVYSWGNASRLMRLFRRPILWANSLMGGSESKTNSQFPEENVPATHDTELLESSSPSATFTFKHSFKWMKRNLAFIEGLEVRVWRSVSTSFMRAFIHPKLLGRLWLRIIFSLEDLLPHLLGHFGQYPLILFTKPADKVSGERH